MHRRSFLKLSVLAPLASGLALGEASARVAPVARVPEGRPHRFGFGRREFLLDGAPFQILSGEMHPARIPRAYWRHRIRMAKAMGLNTIAIYLMWNAIEPEPGRYDFSGRNDFVHFVRLCQDEGMWVYLRPGPYVCAEWDYGGLPPYLLRQNDIRVRSKADPRYMAAVRRLIGEYAQRIAPLMAPAGGPVLMLQLENEYASFGHDRAYLQAIRDCWRAHGIDGPFSLSDGLAQIRTQQTYLEGTALGLDGDTDFAAGQAIAGEAPVWMGEGYPGWLTHWGDPNFASGDFTDTLRRLLAERRSFNLYVVHGGSNFGFTAGANAKSDGSQFQPVITSYDYGAPISERGEATAAFHRFRGLIAEVGGRAAPAIPALPRQIRWDAITPEPHASLWDNLPAPREVVDPQANELLFGQDHGLVLYRRALPAGPAATLRLEGVHDYANVLLDGRPLGAISRVQAMGVHSNSSLPLPALAGAGRLDVLVDSFGHVGYGGDTTDRKGLLGPTHLADERLRGWQAFSLPLDDGFLAGLRPVVSDPLRPGLFFKASLSLDETGDCYLDMGRWHKGYVWVNGRLLGRYWNLGPQQRLYCPGPWLRAGDNEVLVFDLHRTVAAPIRSAATLG